MKLLVTGGAGYVGSVCAARLLEAGHEVVVLDDLSTGHEDAVPAGARFIRGDIAEVIGDVLAEGFDGVLHFAAKSLVGESMQDPGKYWTGNVLTAIHLLDAMKDHGTPKLVFSSTAATYGEPREVPIPETAPTAPTNTYGATKLAIDHAITSYAAAHGLGIALARPPLTVNQLKSGRIVQIDERTVPNPVSYWIDRPVGSPRPAAAELARRIAREAGLASEKIERFLAEK